jgi:mono/diheme cytochrome c family protein
MSFLAMHSRYLSALLFVAAFAHPSFAEDPAATGARIYAENCSTCHGDDLENNSHIAFDLRRLKSDEHARFVNSVLHGKNKMPPWEGVLDAAQIDALWTYIRANAYQ